MTTESLDGEAKSRRLLSLDAFRGATIVAMILVNNPGSWSALYPPLGHAEWHGWTPTDLIFPFFLFIMGTALAYSLRKYRRDAAIDSAVYRRIVRRTALLVGLGLSMGVFGKLCDVVWRDAEGLQLATLRWPGVLQRIGLVYLATSLVVLHANLARQLVLAGAILLGYWGLLASFPADVPPPERLTETGNLVRAVDLAVIGPNHMWTQATSEPTDPEGLLSTLPAIVTALGGYWCGRAVQRGGVNMRTALLLAASGLAVAAIGQLWHVWFPINKKLWTSSFVLLTGGLGAAALAASLAVFDVAGWRRSARPLEIVGVNAIFAFVGSGLLARLIGSIPAGDGSLQQYVYQNAFATPIGDPRLASLAYAAATVTFWWLILAAMARRGWSVRV